MCVRVYFMHMIAQIINIFCMMMMALMMMLLLMMMVAAVACTRHELVSNFFDFIYSSMRCQAYAIHHIHIHGIAW